MGEPMTRGYIIERHYGFVESYYEPATAEAIMGSLPEEELELRRQVQSHEWYPRVHVLEIARAIARAGTDEATVYRDFVACGRFLATEATNNYLRLLLKLLTPALFTKKLPSFWERDNKDSGNFDPRATEISDGYLRLKMVGAEGFEYLSPTAAGFCSVILETMGLKNVEIQQHGWTLDHPGPDSFVLEFTFS